jgi:hypothetical protein
MKQYAVTIIVEGSVTYYIEAETEAAAEEQARENFSVLDIDLNYRQTRVEEVQE